MIRVPDPVMAEITAAAEAAYPKECCGLLIGEDADGAVRVTGQRPSTNVTQGDPGDSFEVDPQVHFDLIRELGDGPARIVGHYHSHPDGAARPSERDRQSAFYPDHVWVIIAVADGRAGDIAAHRYDEATDGFVDVALEHDRVD